MKFAFSYPKGIHKFYWKNIDFVKNLKMTQIAGGGGRWGSCYLRQYDPMRTKIHGSSLILGRKTQIGLKITQLVFIRENIWE